MKTRPLYWVSLETGNKFDYTKYNNHGYGGIKNGKNDLPKDEYPYTIEFEEEQKPKYL